MTVHVVTAETVDRGLLERNLAGHFDYLKHLQERGKLIAAGPFADLQGSMFLYLAESKEEAERLAADDPAHSSGARTYSIREWTPVRLFAWLLPHPGLAGLDHLLKPEHADGG